MTHCKGIWLILLLGMCCACSEKSHITEPIPEIKVVCALNGSGDNGYNDEIVSGIMEINETSKVSLSMISPASMDEARTEVTAWMDEDLSIITFYSIYISSWKTIYNNLGWE